MKNLSECNNIRFICDTTEKLWKNLLICMMIINSPSERMSIKSADKMWGFIIRLLECCLNTKNKNYNYGDIKAGSATNIINKLLGGLVNEIIFSYNIKI